MKSKKANAGFSLEHIAVTALLVAAALQVGSTAATGRHVTADLAGFLPSVQWFLSQLGSQTTDGGQQNAQDGMCGNGIREGAEECDGDDVAPGNTCEPDCRVWAGPVSGIGSEPQPSIIFQYCSVADPVCSYDPECPTENSFDNSTDCLIDAGVFDGDSTGFPVGQDALCCTPDGAGAGVGTCTMAVQGNCPGGVMMQGATEADCSAAAQNNCMPTPAAAQDGGGEPQSAAQNNPYQPRPLDVPPSGYYPGFQNNPYQPRPLDVPPSGYYPGFQNNPYQPRPLDVPPSGYYPGFQNNPYQPRPLDVPPIGYQPLYWGTCGPALGPVNACNNGTCPPGYVCRMGGNPYTPGICSCGLPLPSTNPGQSTGQQGGVTGGGPVPPPVFNEELQSTAVQGAPATLPESAQAEAFGVCLEIFGDEERCLMFIEYVDGLVNGGNQ